MQDLQDDIKAQEDSINSLRETINSKVNLNGYYNFRFFADGSEEPLAFQQHHLGVLMAKQLGKFNFLMELELQNVPHHPEIAPEDGEEAEEHAEAEEGRRKRPQRRRAGGRRERVDGIQSQPLSERPRRQAAVAAVLVAEPLSEPDAVDRRLPIYLRELFPAELVGVTVQGSAAKPVGTSEFGVGYKFYVANNNFEGNSRTDRRDGKSWGARGQVRFPTSGALRRFDVAVDMYRGHVGLTNEELAEDNVFGFESQIEISQFLFQTEWARGKSLEQTRTGYYVQPALRIDEDWITFYRAGAARKPENPAGRAAASGGRELPAVSADCVEGRALSVAAARARLHSLGRGRGSRQAVQRVCDRGGVLLLISGGAQTSGGGVDRSHVDGPRVHGDHPVRRHRQQREPGEVADRRSSCGASS